MLKSVLRRKLTLATAIGLTGVLAACGSSSASSTSSSSDPATSSSAGSISGKKIGVMLSAGVAEVQQRTAAVVDASIKAFGWQETKVDGEGDPSKMQQRLQSLVDSKVDAIVLIFPAPAIIGQQLEAAKAAGIPVVSAGFVAEDTPTIATQYVGDQVTMAKLLTERIQKDFPAGGQFAIINLPGYLGVTQRVDTFKSAVSANPAYKIVAEKDVPQADLFAGTTKAGVDILNANPNLTAFYSCCDFGGQALAPALQQTNRDVPVYSFYAVPSVLPLVRAGKVTVVESDEAKTGAMAIEGLAAYWKSGAPLDAKTQLAAYPLKYGIVDKTNAPADGKDVYPLDEMLVPFLAAWKTQFGI